MNSLVKEVFSLPLFANKPPVLIDVGASGALHGYWKEIAPYAICLAFDADNRELHIEEKGNSSFRKLLVFNSLVHPSIAGDLDFYLTKSPFCSSALEPDAESLSQWAFAEKFKVERKITLKSLLLSDALKKAGLDYVDWFKTDSQGLDLNLFLSLSEKVRESMIIAEFEPGFIDAYKGEDKLFVTLKQMSQEQFWLAELRVKGSQRIANGVLAKLATSALRKKLISFSHKPAPGWGEMLYVNNFKNLNTERELLLGWAMATIIGQHGFAYELADKGVQTFENALFARLLADSGKSIKRISVSRLIPVVAQKIKSLLG